MTRETNILSPAEPGKQAGQHGHLLFFFFFFDISPDVVAFLFCVCLCVWSLDFVQLV